MAEEAEVGKMKEITITAVETAAEEEVSLLWTAKKSDVWPAWVKGLHMEEEAVIGKIKEITTTAVETTVVETAEEEDLLPWTARK